MKEYVHYGHEKFDRKLFLPIENYGLFPKPRGGLWASRVDAKFGWKDWCERKKFRQCDDAESFKFHLLEDTNVIVINSVDDLKKLPIQKSEFETLFFVLDFEKMLSDGVDAIEVNLSSDWDLYMALLGWDCDSILVMNPDIVKTE